MFFTPYLRNWLWIFLLSCLVNIVLLAPSVHMLLTYDYVLTSGSVPTLVGLVGIITTLLLCMWIMDYTRQTLAARTGQRMSLDLQRRAFAANSIRPLREPPHKQGDVIGDISQVRKFLGGTGMMSYLDVPWVPVYLGVEFLLHPLLGWTATAAAAVTMVMALTVEKRSRSLAREERVHGGAERAFRHSVVAGGEVVESHGILGWLYRRWCKEHDQMLLAEDEASARVSFWTTLSKSLRMIAQVSILSIGAWLVIQGGIGPGEMIVGSIVMSRALAPVEQCIGSWRPFVSTREAMKRIRAALGDAGRYDVLDRGHTPVTLVETGLEVADLAAAAPGLEAPIVEEISFAVEPGQIVVVVGPNGSGKSTLLRVLAGAWRPMRGEVRYGGVDIHNWAAEDRGRHIGFLPQSPEFFPGTVLENISGMECDADKVRQAVRFAGCEEAFNRLPKHLDTPVEHGGVNLSAGYRQRLALARAVYGNPSLVILDEPDSGMDEQGLKAIRHAIGTLKASKAIVLVASHNTGMITHADRLLIVSKGKMAGFGPPDKFVRKAAPPNRDGTTDSGPAGAN